MGRAALILGAMGLAGAGLYVALRYVNAQAAKAAAEAAQRRHDDAVQAGADAGTLWGLGTGALGGGLIGFALGGPAGAAALGGAMAALNSQIGRAEGSLAGELLAEVQVQ